MRILIKEQNKIKLSFWLPSGPIVLKTFLKYVTYEGKRINKPQRQLIYKHIQALRKFHRPLVWIDIEQKNGDRIFIKI